MRSRAATALILTTAFSLSLSACNRDRERDGPLIGGEEQIEEEPVPEDQPRKSIFRDDLQQPEIEPELLEPLTVTVPFGDADAAMSEEALTELRQALDSEQFESGGTIVLRGHTDSAGRDAANLRASQRRAERVGEWLIDSGVDAERITIIAMGEQNPVEPNALPDGTPNEEGRAANRRVEVTFEVPEGARVRQDEPQVGDAPALMQDQAL